MAQICRQAEFGRNRLQAPIGCPQFGVGGEPDSSQQMRVDVADATSEQRPSFDQVQDLSSVVTAA